MRKQQIAIIAFALWLTIVSFSMFLAQLVDLGFFFIFSLIGMLMIVQIMQSHYVQPGYQRYFRYLIVVGLVAFGIIVAERILDIIGWEIVVL
jgi:hypothetical protein